MTKSVLEVIFQNCFEGQITEKILTFIHSLFASMESFLPNASTSILNVVFSSLKNLLQEKL